MTGSSRWLLALHSSTAELGVGLRCLDGSLPDRVATFALGRALSNQLLRCVEEVLPAEDWPALDRLAVATGPGGFTGTRLTVVLARTLAQQLRLPLDGVSSFLLAARRLALPGPTWLVHELPRRGLVAGLYAPAADGAGMVEHRQPRLYADSAALAALDPAPQHPAAVAVAEDVGELLALAHQAHRAGRVSPWQSVLPAYPTSPVGAS
ncbi:MAG: tRNA (adenosine(37)-N6)-threonylcarbamoyltransferase complex dimerization subunit type 1 TsaB [Prochlorococcaceae cyanobacterium]